MQVHTKKEYHKRKRILSKIPCHQPPKNITNLNNYIKEFTLRAQPEPLFHFLIMDEILGRLCLNRVKPLKSPRPELLNKSILFSGFFKCKHSFTDKPMVVTNILLDSSSLSRVWLVYRVFSLTLPASMQIYWNKRKRLHKKRVQLPQDWFGTPTWPPFHCFGTQIWPPWRHVKTHNSGKCT